LDYWTRLVSDAISVTLRVIPGSCQHLSVVAKNVSYQDTYDEMLIETADIYGITRDIASRCHEVLSITPHVVADRVREIVFQASEVNG
jgi:cell division FtsZ-interacting protein ZapD